MAKKKKYIFSSNKLKARITELGFEQFEIAQKLNISKTSFSAKMNGKTFFTSAEIFSLLNILKIKEDEDLKEYFFTEKV